MANKVSLKLGNPKIQRKVKGTVLRDIKQYDISNTDIKVCTSSENKFMSTEQNRKEISKSVPKELCTYI